MQICEPLGDGIRQRLLISFEGVTSEARRLGVGKKNEVHLRRQCALGMRCAQQHMWLERSNYTIGLITDHQDWIRNASNPKRTVGDAGLVPAIGEKVLSGNRSLRGGRAHRSREEHFDWQDLVKRAFAK